MDAPLVSVLIITYKHERFIAQALESVLMQQLDGEIEIVIGDDCSPDRTAEIVRDYAQRFPDTIRAVLREHNVGGRKNWLDLYDRCRGKYVAYLEGDDYWLDPRKLQKQVDLLEANPALSMCCTAAQVLHDDTGVITLASPPDRRDVYTLADLAETNFVVTASVLVRNGLMKPLPAMVWRSPVGDWVFHVIHAMQGDLGYLRDETTVYRLHEGGVYHTRRADAVANMLTANMVGRLVADHLGLPLRIEFDRAVARRTVLIARGYLDRGQIGEARATLAEACLELAPELRSEYFVSRARAAAPELNDTYLRIAREVGRARAVARRLPQPVKRALKRALRIR